MYADCHGWKSVNIDMILLLVVSFSINLESYVLMTCDFVNLIIVLEKFHK